MATVRKRAWKSGGAPGSSITSTEDGEGPRREASLIDRVETPSGMAAGGRLTGEVDSRKALQETTVADPGRLSRRRREEPGREGRAPFYIKRYVAVDFCDR